MLLQVKRQLSIDENGHEAQGSVCPIMAMAELGWRHSQK